MAAEHFRSLERELASRSMIASLYSTLESLSATSSQHASGGSREVYNFFATAVSLPGERISVHTIKGNETRKDKHAVITLHPEEGSASGKIAHISLSEGDEIAGRKITVTTEYNVYEDKVFEHKAIDDLYAVFEGEGKFLANALEELDNQENDEKQGFGLLTEVEVIALTAELGEFIDEG